MALNLRTFLECMKALLGGNCKLAAILVTCIGRAYLPDVIGAYISTATALTVSGIHLKNGFEAGGSSTSAGNKSFLEFMRALLGRNL